MAERAVRGFVFTLNNYTPDEGTSLWRDLFNQPPVNGAVKGPVQWGILAKEKGDEKGTLHLQCAIYYRNAKTWTAMRNKLISVIGSERAHLEVMKGMPYQAFEYCTKEGDYYTVGDPPEGAGKRTDIDFAKDMVKEGASNRRLVDECTSYQSLRYALTAKTYYPPKTEFKEKEVFWYWGAAGTGKTRHAIADAVAKYGEDSYWLSSPAGGYWFDGYDQHKVAILDDFRPAQMKYADLLRLLDGLPICVPIKGSMVYWLPEIVYITAPMPPEEMYKDHEHEGIAQLLRRLTEIGEHKHKPGQQARQPKRVIY